jgi:hypothetical protein
MEQQRKVFGRIQCSGRMMKNFQGEIFSKKKRAKQERD